MMGKILVDRDAGQIPASRENSVISGQSLKKIQREKQTLQFGSGVRCSGKVEPECEKPSILESEVCNFPHRQQ